MAGIFSSIDAQLFHHNFGGGSSHFEFASDASGSVGCGAFTTPFWLQLKWAEVSLGRLGSSKEDSITFKELLPVVLAVAVWGPWYGCVLLR